MQLQEIWMTEVAHQLDLPEPQTGQILRHIVAIFVFVCLSSPRSMWPSSFEIG